MAKDIVNKRGKTLRFKTDNANFLKIVLDELHDLNKYYFELSQLCLETDDKESLSEKCSIKIIRDKLEMSYKIVAELLKCKPDELQGLAVELSSVNASLVISCIHRERMKDKVISTNYRLVFEMKGYKTLFDLLTDIYSKNIIKISHVLNNI